MTVRILTGDCRELLASMEAESVDSCVCDPPYHLTSIVKRFGSPNAAPVKLRKMPGQSGSPYARAAKGFMGQTWDGGDVAFDPETWAAVFRVLKPGAHLIAFSGTRTYHRMACAIEDAGFEIRDQLGWLFGSGFPKSHDVAKGIDRHFCTPGEIVPAGAPVKRMIPGADQNRRGWKKDNGREYQPGAYVPGSAEAAEWEGWGTALKPAWEPICLARKPLQGTVAANVLQHGTGAINIDGCRIEAEDGENRARPPRTPNTILGGGNGTNLTASSHNAIGRWPANIIHDGSEEVLAGFPDTGGGHWPDCKRSGGGGVGTGTSMFNAPGPKDSEQGSAARFFYCAKATSAERGEGNGHPTVKPLALMQWLVRLVTPKGGTVLDPFAGSGSTLIAADAEQFDAIGCELSPEYAAIAERRVRAAAGLFGQVEAA